MFQNTAVTAPQDLLLERAGSFKAWEHCATGSLKPVTLQELKLVGDEHRD